MLNDWLQTVTQELEIPQRVRDELGELLKTGKVWLLLDGVDEMAIADALHQISAQMREGWLQNVRVVLTCRLNVWDAGKNTLDRFDVYRNLDFDYPGQVHQFIDRWFAAEPELEQNLKSALERSGKERIRDMVKNPLRLTLLCHSWQLRQGELPETKAGLYEWFVDTFYEWNKGKVPIKLNTAKRKELNHALGELAKAAIDQDSSRFRLREKFINQFLDYADDEESLFYLALQLGWLNRIGVAEENPLENVYAFFHPTFQEYFAALAIEDWNYFLNHNNSKPNPLVEWNGENCTYRAFQANWKEIILLWIGQDNKKSEKESFITALVEFEDGCENLYYNNAYLAAASCIPEYSESRHTSAILKNFIWLSCWLRNNLEIEDKLAVSTIEARQVLEIINKEILAKSLTSLLKSLHEIQNEDEINLYRKLELAELLGNTKFKDREVIKIINKLISQSNSLNIYNPLFVIPILKNLANEYPEAVNALIKIFKEEDNIFIKEMAYSWFLENEKIFSAGDLVKKLDSCRENIWLSTALLKSLYLRDPNNEAVVATLSNLILIGGSDIFYELEWFLEEKKIAQHPKIISTLSELLHTYDNEDDDDFVHAFCALYLGMAQVNKQDVISELLAIRDNGWDEHRRFRATTCLFELGEIDEIDFSDTLFKFLSEFYEGLALGEVAESLSNLYPNDWSIAYALIDRMLDQKWEGDVEDLIPSLEKIIQGALLPIAVTTLQKYFLSTQSVENRGLCEYITHLLRHCARSMTYPDFYRAWHSSSNTEFYTE